MKLNAKDKDLLASIIKKRIRELNSEFLYEETPPDHRYSIINHAIPTHRRILKAVADDMSPKKKEQLYFEFNLDTLEDE